MAYGMTENLGLTALRGDEWLAHAGSVGRGFRDIDIHVVDDHGREKRRFQGVSHMTTAGRWVRASSARSTYAPR